MMSNFWADFWLGEFGLESFKEIVSLYEELMLAFESPKLDIYNPSYGPFFETAIGYPVLTKPNI